MLRGEGLALTYRGGGATVDAVKDGSVQGEIYLDDGACSRMPALQREMFA